MGYFVAIDGLDGSGKATQSKLLREELVNQGMKIRDLSFPMYENRSSDFVKMYLNGELGSNAVDTGAYAASMLFATDRYISYRTDWSKDYSDTETVIVADRYTSANAVHQLSKLDKSEWDDFLAWLVDFEYTKLKLPKPDTVIYLEMLPEISMELIKSRSAETGRKMDIHELDPSFLIKSYEAAVYASDKLGWTKIRCYDENKKIRSIEEIHAEVLNSVMNKIRG